MRVDGGGKWRPTSLGECGLLLLPPQFLAQSALSLIIVGSGRGASSGDRLSVLCTGRVSNRRALSAALDELFLLEIDDDSKAKEDGVRAALDVSGVLAATGWRARRRRESVEVVLLPVDILSVVAADNGSPLILVPQPSPA